MADAHGLGPCARKRAWEFESPPRHHKMDLRYSLGFRLVPKIYLLAQLLILIGFSLAFIPLATIWVNLLTAWSVAIVLELALNALQKKIVHIPDAALISATIIAGVLSTSTPPLVIALVVAISILAKHFLRYQNRHIFNPATTGILLAVLLLGQSTEWWIASNIFAIAVLGLFVLYKLRRLWTPAIFLVSYFLLLFLTTADVSLEFIRSSIFADFSVYFFAFIMLPEPQTAAWTKRGRYVNAVLTALIAVVLTLTNIRDPLIVSLVVVNLFTPIVNEYTKLKRV